jgi:2-amino-4-hydroxy-6-hydroxymethyldihydropteridine diphosphokinase
MTNTAYIALGSNLGEPVQNLLDIVESLQEISAGPLVGSSIWVSKPEGFQQSVQDFGNAIVRMETSLAPDALLKRLSEIEVACGRHRTGGYSAKHKEHQSRLMDLDIVDYAGLEMNSASLTLPHPRAFMRRFVLLPLQEIAPSFTFPNRPESLETLLDKAPANFMVRATPLIPSV